MQGHLHGLLGAAGEQQLPPAGTVAFDGGVGIEVPLVEQHPDEIVGREPGKRFFGFGDMGQTRAVDPGDARPKIAEKVGIDPIGEEKGDVCGKGIGAACGQRQAQAPLRSIKFPLQQAEPLGR